MKSDVELKHDVLAALDWDPSVDEEDIGVTVDAGIVTLSGHVSSHAQKWAAVDTTCLIEGVRGVADEIDVRLAESDERTDSDIARAAADSFTWNIDIPEHKLQIRVESGEVTVEGEVDNHYQREAVDATLLSLKGVRNINNMITLVQKSVPEEIAQKIQEAFIRHARLDANRVDVETFSGLAILRGEVSSWAERRDAEEVAWSSPGISLVENYIEVQPELHTQS